MKACILSPGQSSPAGGRHLPAVSAAVLATLLFVLPPLRAQDKMPDPSQPDLAQQVQALSETLSRTQNQLEQSQRELNELRNQLSALKLQLAAHPPSSSTTPPATAEATPATPSPSSSSTAAAIDDLRERIHKECGRVVSCSDILAIAARDSVYLVSHSNHSVILVFDTG